MGKKSPAPEKTTPPRTVAPKKKQPAIVVAEPSRNGQMVSDEEIRQRAHQLWEAAGKPSGDGFQFWIEAEQELRRSS